MTKRKKILMVVVCISTIGFTVRTLSQTDSSNERSNLPDLKHPRNITNEERKREFAKRREQQRLELERLWNMTEEERKREIAKRKREIAKSCEQQKLELERRSKESARERAERLARSKSEREQTYKEFQERVAEDRKTFFHEKCALRPTEEQWKLIKPKLEKVRYFRSLLFHSKVWLTLTSSNSSGTSSRDSRSRSKPIRQLNKAWEGWAPAELNEVQKISEELMDLLEKRNTTAEEFKEKMDALRKSRSRQEELKRQLSEARQELREVLTARQEAALELMLGWL